MRGVFPAFNKSVVPAYADEPTTFIKIINASQGDTYVAYRLLDVVSAAGPANDGAGTYTYSYRTDLTEDSFKEDYLGSTLVEAEEADEDAGTPAVDEVKVPTDPNVAFAQILNNVATAQAAQLTDAQKYSDTNPTGVKVPTFTGAANSTDNMTQLWNFIKTLTGETNVSEVDEETVEKDADTKDTGWYGQVAADLASTDPSDATTMRAFANAVYKALQEAGFKVDVTEAQFGNGSETDFDTDDHSYTASDLPNEGYYMVYQTGVGKTGATSGTQTVETTCDEDDDDCTPETTTVPITVRGEEAGNAKTLAVMGTAAFVKSIQREDNSGEMQTYTTSGLTISVKKDEPTVSIKISDYNFSQFTGPVSDVYANDAITPWLDGADWAGTGMAATLQNRLLLLQASLPSNISDYSTYRLAFHMNGEGIGVYTAGSISADKITRAPRVYVGSISEENLLNADSYTLLGGLNVTDKAFSPDGVQEYFSLTFSDLFAATYANQGDSHDANDAVMLFDENGETVPIYVVLTCDICWGDFTTASGIPMYGGIHGNTSNHSGSVGNIETVYLEYSNDPYVDNTTVTYDDASQIPNVSTSVKDSINMFTYQLRVEKQDPNGGPLEGASFALDRFLDSTDEFFESNAMYTYDAEKMATGH